MEQLYLLPAGDNAEVTRQLWETYVSSVLKLGQDGLFPKSTADALLGYALQRDMKAASSSLMQVMSSCRRWHPDDLLALKELQRAFDFWQEAA